MNIGIDITSLIYNRGVSRYTSNLVNALAKYTDANLYLYASTFRGQDQLKVALDKALIGIGEQRAAQIKKQMVIKKYPPKLQKLFWNLLKIKKVRSDLPQIDVFHSWDYMQPPDKDLPIVSTIHDLAILKYPQTAHPDILAAHRKSWQILKEKNAQIIAVSKSTKQDVVKILDFPPYQVSVVYEALPQESWVASTSTSEKTYEAVKNNLKLKRPYILFVGTKEPRKNLPRLIDAWKNLSDDIDLVIVGEKGWDDEIISRYKGLRFVERVTDEELAIIYNEASILAYPSLDEGFGLPILEGFYFSLPVVTSNLSAMKEIAGDAGILVDPFSVASIKEGLIKALTLSSKAKKDLDVQMNARLNQFSWQKTAKQTLAVYKKAIEYA
ncbi:MAG: glycosyltransferase family 4 protein [Pseudomonadales bacterium]|jgi:alpha-1,3-rhamnosyl/mannosyltransferase|nr:glycosyltransferase family 4 protein [Pseudomonadales bacterium]